MLFRSTNSKSGTKPVGSILADASPYRCMDMSGNVWEWCADWYSKDYYKAAPVRNPIGPDTGISRVLRGGSWGDGMSDYFNRGACRFYDGPNDYCDSFGFRCAL